MGENSLFSKMNKIKNSIVNLIMEEEDEIKDNGLDDSYENDDKNNTVEKEVDSDEKETKSKNIRDILKNKSTKTLEEDLFNEEKEEDKKIMEFVKESPYPVLEIIEEDEKQKGYKNDFKFEKAQSVVENVTEELTEEQEEAQQFYARLDAVEPVIAKLRQEYIFENIEEEVFLNGFEDTFYSLMDAIESSLALEKRDKLIKMNHIKDEFCRINVNNENEVYECFNFIRHELHKAKNELGEYNEDILNSNAQNYVLDYRIADMYENKETRKMLLSSDMNNFAELMSLTEKMMYRIQDNVWIKSSPEKMDSFMLEYNHMLWGSNTIADVLVGIETLKLDIEDIDNNAGRFTRSSLA